MLSIKGQKVPLGKKGMCDCCCIELFNSKGFAFLVVPVIPRWVRMGAKVGLLADVVIFVRRVRVAVALMLDGAIFVVSDRNHEKNTAMLMV